MTSRQRFILVSVVCAVWAAGAVIWFATLETDWTFDRAVTTSVEQQDPSVCDRINVDHSVSDGIDGLVFPADEAQKMCHVEYAVDAADVDHCRSLDMDDPRHRSGCLVRLAVSLGREDLCEERAALDGSRWADDRLEQCLERVAGT